MSQELDYSESEEILEELDEDDEQSDPEGPFGERLDVKTVTRYGRKVQKKVYRVKIVDRIGQLVEVGDIIIVPDTTGAVLSLGIYSGVREKERYHRYGGGATYVSYVVDMIKATPRKKRPYSRNSALKIPSKDVKELPNGLVDVSGNLNLVKVSSSIIGSGCTELMGCLDLVDLLKKEGVISPDKIVI